MHGYFPSFSVYFNAGTYSPYMVSAPPIKLESDDDG